MIAMVSLTRFWVLWAVIVLGTASPLPAAAESNFTEIEKARSEISILGDDSFV